MRLHRPETQTLYAQLCWQLRDLAGKLRQVYLGLAPDARRALPTI